MKKYFLTGLGILLPVSVTVTILIFLVNFLTKPFVGFASRLISHWNIFPNGTLLLSQEELARYGSRILVLIFLFALALLLGIIARWLLLNSFVKIFDKILLKIPVVNSLYKTCQEIIKALFTSDRTSFKQVVMVPFPRPGVYVLGIIARQSPECCCRSSKKELTSVLIPNTPNPTTGFILMLPFEELILVDMKPEDAIKYIISCGVITPKPSDTL